MPNISMTTITDEQFVKAWQAGASVTAVAEKLGTSYISTSQRAGKLRKAGVKLKEMARGSGNRARTVDAKALNKLIAG